MSLPRAAHRNYPRQFGGGSCCILRVLRRKQRVEDFRYVALDVHFVNPVPVGFGCDNG